LMATASAGSHEAFACCISYRWNITQAIAVFWP
jgi:hypothetical protein